MMMNHLTLGRRLPLAAGCAFAGSLFVAQAAHAIPYAFASNQITGLTVTTVTGTPPVSGRITPTAFSQTVSDSASFGSFPQVTFSNGSAVPGTAVSITQAASGPTAPPTTGYTPAGPGSFIGTRANASIGAGNALNGGVAVDNVAEGSGDNSSFGTSSANNKSTIGFTVLGMGEAVVLSFSDTYSLIASTSAVLGETANASMQDSFSVFDAAGNVVASYAPGALNNTIGSSNGSGPSLVGPTTATFGFTTPILKLGSQYTLALTSGSSENIFPPTAVVPEPASLALLGSALCGLGFLRRRKN